MPARQQGRHFDDRSGRGHAVYGGWYAGPIHTKSAPNCWHCSIVSQIYKADVFVRTGVEHLTPQKTAWAMIGVIGFENGSRMTKREGVQRCYTILLQMSTSGAAKAFTLLFYVPWFWRQFSVPLLVLLLFIVPKVWILCCFMNLLCLHK